MSDLPSTAPKSGEASSSATRKSVMLPVGTHRQLEKAAKQLKVSNTEYASAAIAYFASNGLDPTSQETKGLISVQGKVGEASVEMRQFTAEVGNRLIKIIRTWEGNLYKFLQGQHGQLPGAD